MNTARIQTVTTIRFVALPQSEGCCPMPEDTLAELDAATPAYVEGTIEGFPFRAPVREGCLILSRALREAAGLKPGRAAAVEITRIGDTPEVRVPADLAGALAREPEAQRLWTEITPMARREWVRWIASAKQEQTRQKRIAVGIDKLLHGMRRPCCFPGLNFVTKDLVSPEETWRPLPH